MRKGKTVEAGIEAAQRESWKRNDCQCDKFQCGHLSVRERTASEHAVDLLRMSCEWHDCLCDQLQRGDLSLREGREVRASSSVLHNIRGTSLTAVVISFSAAVSASEKRWQWQQTLLLLETGTPGS